METEPEQNKNVKADIEIIVEKWLKKYGDGIEANQEIVTKFSDLTLNYIYFLVNESDQIADLKGFSYITGEHVKLAIENIETRINVISDKQVESKLNLVKNTRSHALNTDESILNSHNKPQNARKYCT